MTTQYETLHPGKKCPECGGRGKIYRRVPRYAIAMPGVADDWTYEDQECWRCHGDGVARSLGVARCSNGALCDVDEPPQTQKPKQS